MVSVSFSIACLSSPPFSSACQRVVFLNEFFAPRYILTIGCYAIAKVSDFAVDPLGVMSFLGIRRVGLLLIDVPRELPGT